MTNALVPAYTRDTATLRADHPSLAPTAFLVRPGLAEQVAQLIEAYDELVDQGAAQLAERLTTRGILPTLSLLDWAEQDALLPKGT